MKLKGKIVRINQVPKEARCDIESQTITFQYLKKDAKKVDEYFDKHFWDTCDFAEIIIKTKPEL